jgi:MFS family permease
MLTETVNLWGALIYLFVAILSDRYSNRFLPVIIFAPFMMCGYAMLLSPVPSSAKYGACFIIATGIYICAGINFSWLAANSAPDGKRAASVGMQQSMTQLAGVVSGQIYRSTSAPNFTLGHAWSLGSVCTAWIGWWIYRAVLKSRERRKEEMRRNGERANREWDDRATDFRYVF